MRLLLDEMIGPGVAVQLCEGRPRLDVVGMVDRAELRAMPDERVLEFARNERRVLVTRNVADFAVLHQQWTAEDRRHHGIVFVTERAFPQRRNLVGSLVTALTSAARTRTFPAPGEVLFLQPPAR